MRRETADGAESGAPAAVDGAFFAAAAGPMEFILVRHGESEGNAGGIFQGRAEYPLTEKGRAQASGRGRSLAGLPSCAEASKVLLFSSPLGRAMETAELIARGAGFGAPETAECLVELDVGEWTGRSWSELRSASPETWAAFHSRSWAAVESAESPEALYRRAVLAWTFLRDRGLASGARAVVAVSHGGFLQWLVRATFGCRSWFPLLPVHNCGVFRLKVERAAPDRAFIAWESIDGAPDA